VTLIARMVLCFFDKNMQAAPAEAARPRDTATAQLRQLTPKRPEGSINVHVHSGKGQSALQDLRCRVVALHL